MYLCYLAYPARKFRFSHGQCLLYGKCDTRVDLLKCDVILFVNFFKEKFARGNKRCSRPSSIAFLVGELVIWRLLFWYRKMY